MAISLTLSDKQYASLIDALSVSHPNKNVNKFKKKLISKLPSQIVKDTDAIQSIIHKPSIAISSAIKSDVLVRQLIVLDTAKSSSRVSSSNIVKKLKTLFKSDLVLGANVRDLIFIDMPKYKFPGQLIKHSLAEALIDSGLVNHFIFSEYKARCISGSGHESMRIFFKIIEQDSKYSKDIKLLTQLGSHKNRQVAMRAISVAHKKVLPYLVAVTNPKAREIVESRLQE